MVPSEYRIVKNIYYLIITIYRLCCITHLSTQSSELEIEVDGVNKIFVIDEHTEVGKILQ